jgi:hypothetical protein
MPPSDKRGNGNGKWEKRNRDKLMPTTIFYIVSFMAVFVLSIWKWNFPNLSNI